MTRKELNKTRFCGAMKASYNGVIYNILSVDFIEGLFELVIPDMVDDGFWVRYESIDLVLTDIKKPVE